VHFDNRLDLIHYVEKSSLKSAQILILAGKEHFRLLEGMVDYPTYPDSHFSIPFSKVTPARLHLATDDMGHG
jgi:hypothetical protein